MYWDKIKGNCFRGLRKKYYYIVKRGINIDKLMGNKNLFFI